MSAASAIHGKLLALMKEYYWREQPDALVRKFISGSDGALSFSGMGLTWWLTARGVTRLDELSRMIVSPRPQLYLDMETVKTSVEDVLQENATNPELFVGLSFMRCRTLFDSVAGAEDAFADRLWRLVETRLLDEITEWIVVVPLPRVRCPSASFSSEGLYLIQVGDDNAWREVTAGFESARRWNSRTGHADPRDESIMKPIATESWLACRVRGTESVAKGAAIEKMSTLIAVLFAFHFSGSMHVFRTAGWAAPKHGTFFPADESRTGKSYVQMHMGEVVPPLFNDIDVAPVTIERVRDWFQRLSVVAEPTKNRAVAASHFVHHAFGAEELERFIHFFIALDAMFGERGNVENTIATGVDEVFGGVGEWRARSHKLFDLRSELLHGGSSSIVAWKGYDDYSRHFKSDPTNDVGIMALTALRVYPS
jgi:hypothetical protein